MERAPAPRDGQARTARRAWPAFGDLIAIRHARVPFTAPATAVTAAVPALLGGRARTAIRAQRAFGVPTVTRLARANTGRAIRLPAIARRVPARGWERTARPAPHVKRDWCYIGNSTNRAARRPSTPRPTISTETMSRISSSTAELPCFPPPPRRAYLRRSFSQALPIPIASC